MLLGVLAMALRRCKLAALSLVITGWNALLIWPDVSPFRAAPPTERQAIVKVINLNLRFKNQRLDLVAEYLASSGADIIGLVEATPRAKLALTGLRAVYPYSLDCVGSVPECQNMLFSKYPLKDAYAGPIAGRYPTIAIATVEIPGGASLMVGVVHIMTPFTKPRAPLTADAPEPAPRFTAAPELEQSFQAANLAAFLRSQPSDLLVIGDFNSAPWSPLQRAFRTGTGLDNRGRLLLTWPTAALPPFRLPLDPIFVRGRAEVVEIRLGPDVGSDHFPVEAEIALKQ